MFFKSRQLAAALAFGLLSGLTQAAYVVDTGTSPYTAGYSFSNNLYFAGEFTLAETTLIDSIEGYFGTNNGSVSISILSDGGDIPGSVLNGYTTSFNTTEAATDWRGASGLGWSLGAGTYWVSFTPSFVTPGAGNDASMPGFSPNPLAHYAYSNGGAWNPVGYEVGLRIATAAPVPEPSVLLMYGVGIVGLGFMVRRRSK